MTARPLMIAAGLLVCNAAHAQTTLEQSTPEIDTRYDIGRIAGVADRSVPGYERPGISAGTFTIHPEGTVSLFATDNIYAVDTDRRAVEGAVLEPSVSAVRDVDFNRLALSADATIARYFQESSNRYDAFRFLATDTQGIGSSLTVGLRGGYRREVEQRSDPGAITFTIAPVQFDLAELGGNVGWRGNRLAVRAIGSVSTIRFQNGKLADGSIYDQQYRNRNRARATLQIDYSIGANVALRVQGSYARSDYLHRTGAMQIDRNSNRYELLGGAAFNFTDLLTGEIAVGYIKQSFDDPVFRGFSGIGARANVQYQPTQLTTVTINASRTIEEAGLPLAPSYLDSEGSIKIDHELFRSLTISASAQYEVDKFRLPDRSEHRPGGGLSATYRMNRTVSIIAQYDFLKVTSHPEDLGRNITINSGSVGINIGI